MNATDELIRLYAKQLKIPSFTEYQEVLRHTDADRLPGPQQNLQYEQVQYGRMLLS